MGNRFNLRVYGLVRHRGRILACEEDFLGKRVLKFPGGGVDFGEGPEEALVREFREELDQTVQNLGHVYTTGHFVPSLRAPDSEQLVSIYYAAALPSPEAAAPLDGSPKTLHAPHDHRAPESDQEHRNRIVFRWLPLKGLDPNRFALPVDRYVAERFLRRP